MSDANLTELRWYKENSFNEGIPHSRATGTLTQGGQPTDAQTVTIGSRVYRFKNALAAANDVLIDSTAAATLTNLFNAINLGSGSGTKYHASTPANTQVTATNPTGTTLIAQAITYGATGNALASTTTATNYSWGGATLSGALGVASLQELRFTSESLKHAKATVMSEQIRSDRMPTDLVLVGVGANGGINAEFSYGTFNEFFRAMLMGSFVAEGAILDMNFDLANSRIINNSGNWSANVLKARYIRIVGAEDQPNNKIYRIVSSATNTLNVAPGSIGMNNTSDTTARYDINFVRNGVALDSYGLEKRIIGAATYIALTGMCPDGFALTQEARAKVMAVFTFLGYRGVDGSSSVNPNSTAPNTNPVVNTTSNIGTLLYNGSTPAASVKTLNLNYANNLRERLAISNLGTLTPGKGTAVITGDLIAYFTSKAMLDNFMNHDAVSLQYDLTDAIGNVHGIWIPKVRFADGNPEIPGLNQDVMLPLKFQAIPGGLETPDYQIQMDMLPVSGTP